MRIGNRSWSKLGIVMCLTFILGFAAGTATADTLDTIKERGTLVAGVKTDYPPFGYVNSSGKTVGFDIDIAHLFAKALFGDESKVELVSVTSGNRIPYLQSGKIDIVLASMTITDERRQVVEFSKPYFFSGGLLLVPKNSPINGVEDLAGKTVAVIQGSVEDKELEELAPKAKRVKFGKVSEAVLALKTGRADAYAHDDIVILTLAKEQPDLKAVGKAFDPLPFGIAVRKGDVKFIGWVDEQMAKMRQDGTFDKLWKEYFGDIEASLVKP